MSSPSVVLLDTTVLIDILRNRNQRQKLLADLVASGRELAISTVSVAEVYGVLRAGEEPATRALLGGLEWIPVSGEVAERAGRLQAELRSRGQTRGITDMIIAATAIENGFSVATDNRRDFQMEGLELLPLP